jgi:hypothetical protein
MNRPLANQITIEFHLHTGQYGVDAVDSAIEKLKSLGYKILSHELTPQHGAGLNYWSSLFAL